MLSQLLASADSAGIVASLHTRFPDGPAPRSSVPTACTDGPWRSSPSAPGRRPRRGRSGAAGEVDAAPVEFPLVTSRAAAGDGDALGPPWDRGAPADVPAKERRPHRDRHPRAELAAPDGPLPRPLRGPCSAPASSAALRGVGLPHRVVVHDVEGHAAGRLPLARPLGSRAAGSLRDELYRVCLDQGLAHDAAFVVIGAIDVGTLDDREYREAQLAAGLVEGAAPARLRPRRRARPG